MDSTWRISNLMEHSIVIGWKPTVSDSNFLLVSGSELMLARYAKHNANLVLVVLGSLEAQRTKKFIEIVYDFLVKAIELGSFAVLKFGVRPVGLK